MTRYLISFDDGAMTIPEEELSDLAEAARKVVRDAKEAGVWGFDGGVVRQRASIVPPTEGQRWSVSGDQGGGQGFLHRRRILAREGFNFGCQDRCRLPMRTGGTGAHARSERLIRANAASLPARDTPSGAQTRLPPKADMVRIRLPDQRTCTRTLASDVVSSAARRSRPSSPGSRAWLESRPARPRITGPARSRSWAIGSGTRAMLITHRTRTGNTIRPISRSLALQKASAGLGSPDLSI